MRDDKIWDEFQTDVISAELCDRVIVEAGPGTGKTAVACRRLAHLIEYKDLEPTNTWMISFTRVAVKEILDRLQNYVGKDADGIRVATIDSQAWAIHSGHDTKATLIGPHEENIERVIDLLKNNEDVQEEVEEIEHLVIDEAQDIVGVRSDFIEVLVEGLSPECGVTLFVDEAQAIYNFADEKVGKRNTSTKLALHQRLQSEKSFGFKALQLKKIYRTSEPKLKSLFSDVRQELAAPMNHKHGIYQKTAQRIRELATELVDDGIEVKIDHFQKGTLLLFRTRAAALTASQNCDQPHRIRMSEYGVTLPSWLAQCFCDYTDQFLSKSKFNDLWMQRVPKNSRSIKFAERRWNRIYGIARYNDGVIDMHRLRERLSLRSPPIELARTEFGLRGPVVGTIHGSKGQESEKCVLFLPASSKFKDVDGEIEECRVLFVGASRAKSALIVARAEKTYFANSLPSGRSYRDVRNARYQVEVGREGDVISAGLVGCSQFSQEDAIRAQQHLSLTANSVNQFMLDANSNGYGDYQVKTDDGNICVGRLSSKFQKDILKISKFKKYGNDLKPPKVVDRLKSLGSRTVVLSLSSEYLKDIHSPWSDSGFMLAPRIVSFPTFCFRESS